ncbi:MULTISPECIES: ImuA family protein [Acetobacterales]|uniref:ImuA family protein n=1 Tax=Roseomonas sp. WGS1072 TaxID=3366816 RepID=UPI003BF45C49
MPSPAHPPSLASLRERIARLERGALCPGLEAWPGIPLCAALDDALPPGGLPRAMLHEILTAGEEQMPAALGFAAILLGRAGGTVCWIEPGPTGWAAGLHGFGLPPERLVLVQAERRDEALWAMEESLRCPAVAGVLLRLAEGPPPGLTALRRLQLAAERGALALLLRPAGEPAGPTTARTRWRIRPLPAPDPRSPAMPHWEITLLRAPRLEAARRWRVSWDGESLRAEPA